MLANTSAVPQISGVLSPAIQQLHNNPGFIHAAMMSQGDNSPLHLLLPQSMKKNLHDFQRTLEAFDMPYALYFSHKPTQSPVFLHEAMNNNVGVDVSSAAELASALAAGVPGNKISCTGVKDDKYILLSLRHGCLHSIDSLAELKRYGCLKNTYGISEDRRVLLRLSAVETAGRRFARLPSRFGMPVEDLPEAYALLKKLTGVVFDGFHFHNDEPSADVKAEMLLAVIQLMQSSYALGFRPTVLDMGGGFVRNAYANPHDGAAFVHHLEKALIEGTETHTWHRAAYGMALHTQGRVSGLKNVTDKFERKDFTQVLTDILSYADEHGETVAHKIADSGFTLMLEPGRACLEQCGVTLMRVIESKIAPTKDIITHVQGNRSNLNFTLNDPMPDPFLIPKAPHQANSNTACATYLMGNVCLEADIFMRRQVVFQQKPEPGDVVMFANTAAYASGFDDARPHLHPLARRAVAVCHQGTWQLGQEDAYLPHIFNS